MSNIGYTTLGRQSGLLREMQTVANNIANISTNGYKREGLIFSEYVKAMGPGEPSLSMSHANVRSVDTAQGPLTQTGGTFDFAIEGDGYFLLDTANGQMLTRAGSFTPNEAGDLVSFDGARLLDAGGAPIFIPPNARSITLASDGTLSADGVPIGQVGINLPEDPEAMTRHSGTRFNADQALIPAEDSVVLQGFIEGSNVDPITEIAKMIHVQRAYEFGQNFMEKEDERLRSLMQTLGK